MASGQESCLLECPPSSNTVRVRMLDSTTVMTLNAEAFIKPVPKGHETINAVDVCFLIEHQPSGQKVMFDLGCRKDYWNHPPAVQSRLGQGRVITGIRVDKGVPEILEEGGVALSSISHAIWSHYHWDHVGDVSLFPSSTSLVVGPGFKDAPLTMPGYPPKKDAMVSASHFEGRPLVEIDFDKSNHAIIGGFQAYDFFGDGSFYLLNTPGHCIGHMCGLARTTNKPESFVFMGGDITHFAGIFRPNKGNVMPDPISANIIKNFPSHARFPVPCPCSVFTDHHPQKPGTKEEAQRTTWYLVSDHERSSYADPQLSQKSVDTMKVNFDAASNVLVCIAHDPTLLEYIPTFNREPERDLAEWMTAGWKEKVCWGWLDHLPKDGQAGRDDIVDGLWRDGKKWEGGGKELIEESKRATS